MIVTLATHTLDEVLERACASIDPALAPAMTVAVFDAGGTFAWRGIGEPRRDGVPVRRGTVFRIASMSKSFLAATALALADEGRLDLDAAIAEYVPGVRFVRRGAEQQVTVRELITNRGGMPEDNAWADRQLGASREDIATLANAGFELTSWPGERYQYSNLGMSLVARAIESVCGRAYEEEVLARFIEPLGLSNTRFSAAEYPPDTDLALGFRTFDGGESFREEPYVDSGALACIGGLFSTLDDIASWVSFLVSAFGDDPERPDLLSARSRREMQRAHTAIPVGDQGPSRDLDAFGYAMGLFAEHDKRYGSIAQHSGGLPGFSSHMRWHLASGIGAAAFGNSDAFRGERLAAAALSGALEVAGAASVAVLPWPETLRAAERIDALVLGGGGFEDIADLAASNLLRDVPEDVRQRRLAELREQVGALVSGRAMRERIVSAQDAAHLRWHIPGETGVLVCDLRMVGLSTPLVQSLTVALAEGDTAKPAGEIPSASDHSRVLV